MTNNLKIELYKLTDSFLTEAKDQNGNDRSLECLNQDRHLFVENCLMLIQAEREKAVKDYEYILKQKIGLLRQWLNEDRIDSLRKMVSNEQIEKWLIN